MSLKVIKSGKKEGIKISQEEQKIWFVILHPPFFPTIELELTRAIKLWTSLSLAWCFS